MTTENTTARVDADARRVLRELVDAASSARPYVYNTQCAARADRQPWREETASAILDRLDGALADAGELLAEGSG